MSPSLNVVDLNPLAAAETELTEYFESSAEQLGVRAQNPDPDRTGGVWDEAAIDRLHRSRLRRGYREAVARTSMVEKSLMLVGDDERRTIVRAFERRGYAYRTELGGARLWQATRRQASNVGLLGLVIEVVSVADECVAARARADKTFDVELAEEPSRDMLLAFLEETVMRAFERWDSRRAPGTEAKANDAAWMVWLPKWFGRAKRAANMRLTAALRAYEDVLERRAPWEDAQAAARARKQRAALESRLDRLVAIAGGRT